jgi:hypothetical protein
MRLASVGRGLSVAVALAAISAASDAHAQGFFEQLFGLAPAPKLAPQSITVPGGYLTPGGRPYQMPSSPFQTPRRANGAFDVDTGGARYRTVCVRLCDGFFFPISNATTRRGIVQDQARCDAQCGEAGRLFQMPVGSHDLAQATDNTGRTYVSLRTAFLYKKQQVAGCQCRPPPWSEAEASRHRRYAEAEAAGQSTRVAEAAPAETTVSNEPAVTEKVADAPPVSTKPAKRIALATVPKPKPALGRGPRPVAIAAAKPQGVFAGGGMGLGAPKYTWPGDAPRR